MSKTMLDGADELTIKNFYKIYNRKFWICSFKCELAEAIRSISYQPKSTEIILVDKATSGIV